jgi:hypothetical protein
MRITTIKKLLYHCCNAVLIALCFWGVSLFCNKKTRGFSIVGISANRPFHKEWQCRPLTLQENREFEKAVGQRYSFLNAGGQCFVFISEDRNYVIKFFSQSLYFPIPLIFDRYRDKKKAKKADKLARDFASYKNAFEEFSEEGGLVFVHLNASNHLKKIVKIVDKIGIEHKIDLDQVQFVVQRKAELVYDWVRFLMASGQEQKAQKAVEDLLHLIVTRCKKGYRDRDPQIEGNCGFINGKAMKIDVGRFVKDESMKEPEKYKNELLRISLPFIEWLEKTYPSLASHYKEELAKLLE